MAEAAASLLQLPHVTLERTAGIANPLGPALVEGKWQVHTTASYPYTNLSPSTVHPTAFSRAPLQLVYSKLLAFNLVQYSKVVAQLQALCFTNSGEQVIFLDADMVVMRPLNALWCVLQTHIRHAHPATIIITAPGRPPISVLFLM